MKKTTELVYATVDPVHAAWARKYAACTLPDPRDGDWPEYLPVLVEFDSLARTRQEREALIERVLRRAYLRPVAVHSDKPVGPAAPATAGRRRPGGTAAEPLAHQRPGLAGRAAGGSHRPCGQRKPLRLKTGPIALSYNSWNRIRESTSSPVP